MAGNFCLVLAVVFAVLLLDVGTGPYALLLAAAGLALLFGGMDADEQEPTEAQAQEIRAAVGCLLGTALGDAVGLPMEGLSRRRLQRMYPSIDGPRLLFGFGLCSDDTEHGCMVAAVDRGAGRRCLGFTTADALAAALAGWPRSRRASASRRCARDPQALAVRAESLAGRVFRRQRRGDAQRTARRAVRRAPGRAAQFRQGRHRLARTATQGRMAPLAVASPARESALGRDNTARYLQLVATELQSFGAAGEELLALVQRAADAADHETTAFADALGLGKGVSGYAYHTVPVCLQAWFRHPLDYRAAVLAVIACGGDTDTGAAIVGGIVGAGVGREGLPAHWLARLVEWPASVRWMEASVGNAVRRLRACRCAGARGDHAFLVLLPRNLLFMLIVLAHGFRRLLPPY